MSLTKKNKIKLSSLVKLVSGSLSGDREVEVASVALPENAQKGSLVFILDRHLTKNLDSIPASAFVIEGAPFKIDRPCLFVKNGRYAMAKILPLFESKKAPSKKTHKTAVIGKNVKIGKGTTIGPYVVIGDNCTIGSNCTLHPNVVIYANTCIGNRVIIHSGSVIGLDGFGFVPEGEKHLKIPQLGNVIIEDDVEIFSNVTVARATLGSTIIKKGTKIDCQSQIAHNCSVGDNCILTAFSGLAGSTILGKHVIVGGMVGFAGHLSVGDNAMIAGRAGVTKNIPAGAVVSGFPAIDHAKDMEIQAFTRKLPALYKRVEALEQKNSKS